jgi:hypothetical protein
MSQISTSCCETFTIVSLKIDPESGASCPYTPYEILSAVALVLHQVGQRTIALKVAEPAHLFRHPRDQQGVCHCKAWIAGTRQLHQKFQKLELLTKGHHHQSNKLRRSLITTAFPDIRNRSQNLTRLFQNVYSNTARPSPTSHRFDRTMPLRFDPTGPGLEQRP